MTMKVAYGNSNPFAGAGRAPSVSSRDRLLLDPAGEGEDILNEESTPPYNVGRRKGNNNKVISRFEEECLGHNLRARARPMRFVRPWSVDSAISSKSAPQLSIS
jgi:hypothetical protein